jgi:hypothetical protein
VLLAFSKHIYNRSIAEIFVKLITNEKNIEEGNEEITNNVKRSAVFQIINHLHSQNINQELYLNINYVVGEIIGNKTLYAFLIEDEFVNKLLELVNDSNAYKFICVCKIISSIVS